MRRLFKAILTTAALALTAGGAQAGNVHWSVGINLPPVATVISNGTGYGYGPVYAPEPVYYAPPVVYRPAPVYYPPPVYYPSPVYYGPSAPRYYGPPAPRYYGPPAVVIDRRWGGPRGHWEHRDHDRGHGRGEGRWDRR